MISKRSSPALGVEGPYRKKLFGLTIRADRLHECAHERRPGSTYSSLENCEYEFREADILMRARRHFRAGYHDTIDRRAGDKDPA